MRGPAALEGEALRSRRAARIGVLLLSCACVVVRMALAWRYLGFLTGAVFGEGCFSALSGARRLDDFAPSLDT